MERVLIQLTQVSIGYGRALLRPLSFCVRQGDFWGIVGPNGAGKSTLIRTILGLIPAVEGRVEFPGGRVRLGYVPQRVTLNAAYPLCAQDIVLMGRSNRLRLGQRPSAEDRDIAREELRRLGLEALSGRLYASLSGGQQQRVLLARALASEPQVLILDEPMTGMDLPGEADILAFLQALHRESGTTILMIAHDLEKVARVALQLCLINKDTDLYETGPQSELMNPERLSMLYGRSIDIDAFGNGYRHIRVNEVRHD